MITRPHHKTQVYKDINYCTSYSRYFIKAPESFDVCRMGQSRQLTETFLDMVQVSSLYAFKKNKIAKIQKRNLKFNLISRTTEQISTKLGTEHLWVQGIQVCSNIMKGHLFHARWDNYEIAKIHWRNFNIFSEPMGQFQQSLAQSILGLKMFFFLSLNIRT